MISIKKIIFSITIVLLIATCINIFEADSNEPIRIWILPFNNTSENPSLANLKETIPELLEVFLSHLSRHAVVDRKHLDKVLAEQTLSLKELVSLQERQRIGKSLGATVMINGGFIKEVKKLIINAHAYDIESGRLLVSKVVRDKHYDLAELVNKLYRGLIKDLQRLLPNLGEEQIDESPISNFHFMRGLSFYYSVQYNQALAEFIQVARAEKLFNISRFWMVNCYLAQEKYEHAYIELKRLKQNSPNDLKKDEIESKLNLCLQYLSADEIESYNKIISP